MKLARRNFSDIFETAYKPTPGFTAVKTNSHDEVECLKVKPGMEKAAAFLESRRYGAIKGATAEFNKMEGLVVNEEDNKAYMAIPYQNGSKDQYVLSNYQHPGADIGEKEITAVDKEKLEEAMKESLGIMETGVFGYISGIPGFANKAARGPENHGEHKGEKKGKCHDHDGK